MQYVASTSSSSNAIGQFIDTETSCPAKYDSLYYHVMESISRWIRDKHSQILAAQIPTETNTRTHQEMSEQTSTFYDDMARTYFKILKKRTYFV